MTLIGTWQRWMLEFSQVTLSALTFMRSDLLPPQFPAELAAAAFLAGGEVAWPPALAVLAVEWFGSHNYAVLGYGTLAFGRRWDSEPTNRTGRNARGAWQHRE
jgi:hypothetical protein